MLRISAAVILLTLIGAGAVAISPASADSWGCSSDKCLQACGKAGGHNCSNYCDKALRDKQTSRICK